MPDLITPADVADLLDVTVEDLRRWRCRGQGPAFVRRGHSPYYTRRAVADWVNEPWEMPAAGGGGEAPA
ncbi:MAG TPA: helix-turn-helix domain-containing protein [Phycisphaerae bacterium]|nr:helix-turn-helix domain-containing protein [Phycisphaerae bacterium]